MLSANVVRIFDKAPFFAISISSTWEIGLFCQRWCSRSLLSRADLLSFILLQNSHVTGVALTGSLARFEPLVHDIDLVVLHGGKLQDISCRDPWQTEEYYSDDLPLACILEDGLLSRHLGQAADDVPVNYIFVQEQALWDCGYLQSLTPKERFPGFYRRVFCDIPLYLLSPYYRRGDLKSRINTNEVCALEQKLGGLAHSRFSYPAVRVRHVCESPGCIPAQTWEECRAEMNVRKNHWWHD